jgi:hypothetical protein
MVIKIFFSSTVHDANYFYQTKVEDRYTQHLDAFTANPNERKFK